MSANAETRDAVTHVARLLVEVSQLARMGLEAETNDEEHDALVKIADTLDLELPVEDQPDPVPPAPAPDELPGSLKQPQYQTIQNVLAASGEQIEWLGQNEVDSMLRAQGRVPSWATYTVEFNARMNAAVFTYSWTVPV